MTKYRVAIARCPDYDPANVGPAIAGLLKAIEWPSEQVDGLQAFLKPNLLMARLPDQCVTTHPAITTAVGRQLAGQGYRLLIGDSPGGPSTPTSLRRVYETTATAAAAAECGAQLCYDLSSREVVGSQLAAPRRFLFTAAALDSDVLVNLSKLKTHGLTGLTAAVKNLFGCVPGLEKTKFHMNHPTVESFAEAMVDIAHTLSPRLSICDGVIAMEGAGPSHGRPRQVGLIFASSDAFALDYAIARLLGVGPGGFTTVDAALRRGYGPQRDEDIEVVLLTEDGMRSAAGEAGAELLASLRPAQFDLLSPEVTVVVKSALRVVRPLVRSRPVFREAKCTRCGTCLRSCPAKALKMGQTKPAVDLEACIRCYCCQELCPEGAVEIHRPLAYRLAMWMRG